MNIQELQRRFPAAPGRFPMGMPMSKHGIDLVALAASFAPRGSATSPVRVSSPTAGASTLPRPPDYFETPFYIRGAAAEEVSHWLACEWTGGISGAVEVDDYGGGTCETLREPERASDQALTWAAGMAGMEVYYAHMFPGQPVPDGRRHDRQQHALVCGLTGLAAERRWIEDKARCREIFQARLDTLLAGVHFVAFYRSLTGDQLRAAVRGA